MILFKACPRCGGDVDASYDEDISCVQCGFRPHKTYTAPQLLEGKNSQDQQPLTAASGRGSQAVGCPRCALENVIPLERLRPRYNICYRCRECGHIFSPALSDPSSKAKASRL